MAEPDATPSPAAAAPEPISDKSGHDSWPPLTGDTERTDPNEKLEPAVVVTPRGATPPPAERTATPPAAPDDETEIDDGTIDVRAHQRRNPNAPPISRTQQRINQAISAQRNAERRAAEAQQQLADLQAQLAARQAPTSGPTGQPQFTGQNQAIDPRRDPDRPKPTVDQFKTYEDFVEALTDWKTDRHARAVFAAQAQLQQQQVEQTLDQQFTERRAKWMESHPDYNDVVGAMDHIAVSPPMEQFFKHDPDGVAVIDYLARHPDDAERLSALPLGPTFVELGRIKQIVQAQNGHRSGVAAHGVSRGPRAPAPITPVGAGEHRSTDPGDLEFGPEYVRRGNEADRQRRRAGLR